MPSAIARPDPTRPDSTMGPWDLYGQPLLLKTDYHIDWLARKLSLDAKLPTWPGAPPVKKASLRPGPRD